MEIFLFWRNVHSRMPCVLGKSVVIYKQYVISLFFESKLGGVLLCMHYYFLLKHLFAMEPKKNKDHANSQVSENKLQVS